MCQALGLAACPIAFWRGDLTSAARLTQNLLEYARRYTFNRWVTFASCYELTLRLFLDGTTESQVQGTETGQSVPDGAFFRETLATIHDHWIDRATLDRARRGLCGWSGPEILRAAAAREPDLTESATVYEESRRMAQTQNALAWELRSIMSLAGIWSEQDRRLEAAVDLRSVYARFEEGLDTADLKQARELLDTLEN